jgi:hypothetical protein
MALKRAPTVSSEQLERSHPAITAAQYAPAKRPQRHRARSEVEAASTYRER